MASGDDRGDGSRRSSRAGRRSGGRSGSRWRSWRRRGCPFARAGPMESDEWMFVAQMGATWFPTHHTLFQTAGRAMGLLAGDAYRGLVVLDMLVSALALASVWWWLRALVRPSTAAASTVVVGVAPLFWSLGRWRATTR